MRIEFFLVTTSSMQVYLILGVLVSACVGFKLHRPMENPHLYHGDIAGIDITNDKNAIPKDSQRWSQGKIYYTIDASLNHLKSEILKAMKYISDRTCLEFIPRSKQRDYIKLYYGDGCFSHWGRTGGVQPLSLGEGCEPFGTIVHELAHAIGFDHEQNRSDRDDYIIVYYNNIDPDFVDQFQKLRPHENRLINKFDYNSIMMYGDTAFSIDGYKKTMKAKKKGVKLTNAYDKMPTKSDMYRINYLYQCNK